MGTFERKILRKIFEPFCVEGEYRRRMKHKLYELYDDVELARRAKIQQLRWIGYVLRMDNHAQRKGRPTLGIPTRR